MGEPIVLTDAKLDAVLAGEKPVFILFTAADGLRGDFSTAYKKAAAENPAFVFAKVDSQQNPQAAERFEIGSKSVLVGWCGGQEIVRRSRPWGADVPLALEKMQAALAELKSNSLTQPEKQSEIKPVNNQPIANDQPVHVTDATFEAEVLEYSKEMPVLIDFWAEWCGPCRMVAPTLEKMAKEFAGKIRIAKVDTDANQGLSQAFRIMSIPTIMIIKERTMVFNQPGALPESAFRDLIQQAIALELPPREEQEAEETVTEE